MERPGFIHTVYFYLKEGVSESERKEFHQGVAELTKCNTILDAYIGPPAGTPREVVDNTYDYCLQVFFKDKEAHDAYQDDPEHHHFIDQYKHLWERVQIYDHLPV